MRPLLLLLLLPACGPASGPPDPTRTALSLDVVATSAPVGWLAGQIVGDDGQVTVMVPEGADAAHWRPEPDAIAGLAEADLIVAQGAGYEPWLTTASLPRDRLVRTTTGLDLVVRAGVTHSHGDAGAHHHGEADPHTWLDPFLFLAQAQSIHRHVVRAHPNRRAAFDRRLSDLRERLLSTHETLAAATTPLADLPMAGGPDWTYLARRYDLDWTLVDLPTDAPPDEEALAALSTWAAAHADASPVVLWTREPPEAARRGLPSVHHANLDPLARPRDGRFDWPRRMVALAGDLQRLVSPTGG